MALHDLPLVYKDGWLLVFDKPARLLSVHGKFEPDNLIDRVNRYYPEARIVHRLDYDTSGLILLARDRAVHRNLSAQFAQRRVCKKYVAVCHGHLSRQEGQIVKPLIADWPQRPRQKVDWMHGKPADTYWHVLAKSPNHTRLLLTPRTGRSHQLRLHLASIGFPIVGDRLYGTNDPSQHQQANSRLLLHAAKLSIRHPFHGKIIDFCAPSHF